MDLTSLRRVKLSYGFTNNAQDIALSRVISSGSRRIAAWLNRLNKDGSDALQLKARTEYLSPRGSQIDFYMPAYPIASIGSVAYDYTGLYAGSEVEFDADDYIIGDDLRVIRLLTASGPPYKVGALPVGLKTTRIVYTAGLAVHPVKSIYAITTSDTAMTVGYYVQGNLSGCIGYILAATTILLTFELLSGIPQVGETFAEYASLAEDQDEGGLSAPTDKTAVLGAASQQCLAELYPDIVEAAEIHVKFMQKKRTDFDNYIVMRDGETRSSNTELMKDFFSIPQVRDLLMPYRNDLIP